MNNTGFWNRTREGLLDACYIWWQEMKGVVKDEGVLIFFILVPLAYPLLYSWIYNNEIVHEVPVVVVDDSRSALSREFVRHCDASPDVMVKCHAADMEEARTLIGRQEVKGIYYIPSDFSTRLARMEQTAVSVYCDMSLMLTYKAIFQTATAVSQDMNGKIQIKLSGNYTDREDEITTMPLKSDDVPIFNSTSGYGNFILPGVLMLIIQQTLVLGIGLAAGTARETNRFRELIPISRHYRGVLRIVTGKAMCYLMIYAVLSAYLTLVIPRLFGFVNMVQGATLATIMLPYLLACIFFGMTVSCLIRYRENVMLIVIFCSVPLLFLSGVSWPQSNIPGLWQGVSWLFPSTFGVRAFVRTSMMGATIDDVTTEYAMMWVQTLAYFFIACAVYRYQISLSRRKVLDQLNHIRHKREVRRRLKAVRQVSGGSK
ncbi:MAG: ABC transporter permease [Prevotella sp.]|nr:ABC transporter permease [Prevotella sp.]